MDVTEVGIAGIACYFPRTAVSQADLERFYGVEEGRYTVGLGQNNMAVVEDTEDVVSLSLTVLQRLVEKYNLSYADIGRLEVGTETIIDKSKSVKSSLMRLFVESGNFNVEGLDNTNACYGSTAAVFNVLAWAESSAWDGRVGVVVAADIAVYRQGTARPTGGAGAVALLIARGGYRPIRFEIGLRASCFGDSHDFFKPDLASEYPVVNGPETIGCFVRAIDACYLAYRERFEKKMQVSCSDGLQRRFCVAEDIDYFVCHSPFNKMVQRAFARLVYNDFMETEPGEDSQYEALEVYRSLPRETSYTNKDATRAFVAHNRALYYAKCEPGTWIARETGNCYTASLYTSLAALVHRVSKLEGARILMFAFGSGFASSMFSLRVVSSTARIARSLGFLESELYSRRVLSAAEYDDLMLEREENYCRFDWVPRSAVDSLFPGTFYLSFVGKQGQRSYKRLEGSIESRNEEG